MEERKIRIAITHGDTNGIGYELILKSFADNSLLELFTPIVYGSPKVAAYHRKAIDIPANFSIITTAEEARHNRFNLLTTFEEEVRVELGAPSAEAGSAAFRAMRRAFADVQEAKADALVLSPADNESMHGPEYQFDSDKSYMEMMCDNKDKTLLMYVIDHVRIATLTDHKPLREVPAAINEENLTQKLQLLHGTMKRDFGISDPRIALVALNGNDSNGHYYGNEENDIVVPVVNKLNEQGMKVYGPYPTLQLLPPLMDGAYDAVLTMYDEQATMLMQTLTDHVGYQYIAGLPKVVTKVNHGTDYAAAGRNTSDTSLLRHAIYAAIDILRQREAYDEAHENPLPKLYHERRDEGEKVRFAIPGNRRRNFNADNVEGNGKTNADNNDMSETPSEASQPENTVQETEA